MFEEEKITIDTDTTEKFDTEEVNTYLSMALDELYLYECFSNTMKKWIRYRVLSIANSVLSVNRRSISDKNYFSGKAEAFREKMPRLKAKVNRQTAANSRSPKQRKLAKD
jgi:hypothetical protein